MPLVLLLEKKDTEKDAGTNGPVLVCGCVDHERDGRGTYLLYVYGACPRTTEQSTRATRAGMRGAREGHECGLT